MSDLKSIIRNCHKATFLIEKKQLGQLNLLEKIRLLIHLAGCDWCRLYDKQSHKINIMVAKLFHSANNGVKLDDNFKTELQERIEEELNKN